MSDAPEGTPARRSTTVLPEAAAAAWLLFVLAEELLPPALDCLAQWRRLGGRLLPLFPSDLVTRSALALWLRLRARPAE